MDCDDPRPGLRERRRRQTEAEIGADPLAVYAQCRTAFSEAVGGSMAS